MPKHAISRLVGKLAAAQAGPLTTGLIKVFINAYGINMNEAQQSDAKDYKTFNQFFTRPLKDGMRPIDQTEQSFVHPVDGTVSQLGDIVDDNIFSYKPQAMEFFKALIPLKIKWSGQVSIDVAMSFKIKMISTLQK